MAVAVEILLLTASRSGERYTVEKGFVRYPAHKRGLPRRFPLEGRLAELVRLPRAWSRRTWKRTVADFGRPGLVPHDLRHTAITKAFHDGWSWKRIQELGGWKSPQMPIRTYSHLFSDPARAVSWGRHGAGG